ncbi:Vacuolar protein sorting-associated protein IST1 [Nakaseomyces bracarensis]|uniref:Vacuolar protein sorting-associated protein IST1 n=1 Tax=Nakaseomyces bracarensis TaxID=273131 RepID=A0ABR4NQB2_9SACH
MCIQRLRYAQEKQQALAKQGRREVAQLLGNSKEQKARYRAESLIHDDMHIELLEVLELYCELLHARVSILATIEDEATLIEKHSDDGINEAVRALIYSTLHANEVKELTQMRDLLIMRFGPEMAKLIIDEKLGVPDKVLKKCSPNLPSSELVDLYLKEIARTYDVPFSLLTDEEEESSSDGGNVLDEDGDDVMNDSVDNDGKAKKDDGKPILAVNNEDEFTADSKHPIKIRRPRKESDTLDSDLKIPKDVKGNIEVKHKKKGKKEDDELDALKKRFEALRR